MLRTKDIRRVYRLLDACLQVGMDPDGWRHRLALGVLRVLRAKVVITGEFLHIFDIDRARALHALDVGWSNPAEQAFFVEYQLRGANRSDPLRAALTTRKSRLLVASLASILDYDAYRQSDVYQHYMLPAGVGDQLVAISEIAGSQGERWNMVTALRAAADDIFSADDRRLMRILAGELSGLVGTRLADSTSPVMRLTPRQHHTLRLLLEGGSESAIAERMNLSRPTVHKYVAQLYRMMDVSSRAELQARFAGLGRMSHEREQTSDPRRHRVRREGTPMAKPWRAPETIRRHQR